MVENVFRIKKKKCRKQSEGTHLLAKLLFKSCGSSFPSGSADEISQGGAGAGLPLKTIAAAPVV